METTTMPLRAYRLHLAVYADDRESLAEWLRDLARQVEDGSIGCVFGGPSLGGKWDLTHDPAMTAARYRSELRAWAAREIEGT